jgi:hypothetical protein
MHISNTHDAKAKLSELVKRALAGKEVVIAKAGEPPTRPGFPTDTGFPQSGPTHLAQFPYFPQSCCTRPRLASVADPYRLVRPDQPARVQVCHFGKNACGWRSEEVGAKPPGLRCVP